MKYLKEILYKVALNSTIGNLNIKISGISFDSRKVKKNNIFIALPGTLNNGTDFIDEAIYKGVIAVVCEKIPKKKYKNISFLEVSNSNKALAVISNNFYNNPSNKIKLIGITGTNGKTTTASLLYELFKSEGYAVGLISTISFKFMEIEESTSHTTPDPIQINQYLNRMIDAQIEYCFMEVSSHGIFQNRIYGLNFKVGVFMNLSHDHLDYHKTFKEYRDVKKIFFDQLPKAAFALSNIDDKNGRFMLQNTVAQKKTFSINAYADYTASIQEIHFSGMLLKINNNEVWTHLIGSYNASNILAVYAVAMLLKLDSLSILSHLSRLKSVKGRFEVIKTKKNGLIIIDYAHTPEALKKVLNSINELRTGKETLITIIGCGGDRDKKKRPIMGEIASKYSDKVIFTSDNPRDEDPKNIIKSMCEGVSEDCLNKIFKIVNREKAIHAGCEMLSSEDILLIAGKGHETYQEVSGVKRPFDEFKIIKKIISKIE